ncbi:MAG TPA: Hsp33 family molecular chaperone HslO [Bacillota bacterium]
MAMTGDHWVRALAGDGSIRVLAARTTATVDEGRRRHRTAPTATAALGRVLTATALLTATLKDRQRVTLRVIGDGPLGALVGDGRASGAVRGYVQNPDVDLPLRPDGKLDVGRAVGRSGFIHVTRDLGLREPYTGTAPLVSGEIGEDLTAYFLRSEQTPSLVALGVLVDRDGSVRAAGGFFVQLLPGADPAWAERLEANARGLGGISRSIESGLAPADVVAEVLAGFDYRILEQGPIHFACSCSRQRARELLVAVGRQELEAMLADDDRAELVCHFCGRRYHFEREEIADLLRNSRPDS